MASKCSFGRSRLSKSMTITCPRPPSLANFRRQISACTDELVTHTISILLRLARYSAAAPEPQPSRSDWSRRRKNGEHCHFDSFEGLRISSGRNLSEIPRKTQNDALPLTFRSLLMAARPATIAAGPASATSGATSAGGFPATRWSAFRSGPDRWPSAGPAPGCRSPDRWPARSRPVRSRGARRTGL